MKKLLFLLIINALCESQLYAAKIYKHAPFALTIAADDMIVVEYDLSNNRGLYCTSNNKNFQASFTYKGRDKTATLPVTLQNYRVPSKSGEELADTTGNIMLMLDMSKATQAAKIKVKCEYNNQAE